MKGNKETYRCLIEVVNDALSDVGESQHKQYQFLRWGMKYCEEQYVDFNPDIRTINVNLKPWKAIELPSDCLEWCAFGIQNGNDVMTFVNDRKMALQFTENAKGVQQPNLDPSYYPNLFALPTMSDFSFPFLNYNYVGEDRGKIFGLRVKDNGLGYFSENKNKDSNEIQFRFSCPSTVGPIYLMYLSNLWDPKEETLIHPFFAEYIVAGIKREYYGHRPGEGQLLDFAEKEFDRQYLKLLDRKWEFSVESILEYIKSSWTMTPKIP